MTQNCSGDGDDDNFGAVMNAARIAAADIALITDDLQAITYVSASFTAMTGYEPAELIGRNCRVLQGSGTDPDTKRYMREVLASGEVFEGRILNYRRDGSAFWTALKIIPMRVGASDTISHFVSVQRDISNQVAMLEQLQSQALHDHVTGLPNRVAAERALEESVKRPPHLDVTTIVGLIDLDDFRTVNNTLGHAAGDAVLQQWATRVSSRLREGDLLARMGGDEFLLILKDITRDAASQELSRVLRRIERSVEEPFWIDDEQVRIGMSMGVALIPQDGTDSRSILRSADEALYAAKKRDGNATTWWETAAQVHRVSSDNTGGSCTTGSDGPVGDRSRPAEYLDALRNGDILVHLQPVVDLRDGSVHLFESLARLKLAGGRIAYPSEFLSHIGADDLRVLFTGVLDRTLKILADWDRLGARHNVSVNLPPEILDDADTPALVEKCLDAHRTSPGRLSLELLESENLSLEGQRAALQALAALGVGLAIDDLGSGYSSLQRLSSFPFNTIKLDRELFHHIYDRPFETLSVMATLIQLGRDLGMNVVIEGLENEGLTEAATILGAPFGQGYYFARPMPTEDCISWADSFEFQPHRAHIRTPLGALAYHLQFARLASPHPLELQRCPLTRFINEADAPDETKTWHVAQHMHGAVHPGCSRFLTNWLAQHVSMPELSCCGGPVQQT